MNPFVWLWESLVFVWENLIYKPQLNLLEGFYYLTGDIGWSIVLLALVINLLLWPLFGKSYVNTQKMRLLQPQIREIQEEYKSNPQQMMKETRVFYQKHNIKNSTTFLILVFQIFFATGLYRLTTDLSNGSELKGLYPIFFENEVAQFNNIAFGFLDISDVAREHFWLPLLASIFSYLMGMYMFRWAPKPKLPEPKKKKKPKKKEDDKPSPLDPEAFQKSLEFQSIYVFPIIIFVVNFSLTTGVAIYFVTVNFLALMRQIFLINFYRTHVDKLVKDITESDPSYRDNDPSNNLKSDIDPSSETEQPVPAKELSEDKASTKKKTTGKKTKTAKLSTKTKKKSKK
jgi:YidC/Oxa1 family membrane protein insertase